MTGQPKDTDQTPDIGQRVRKHRKRADLSLDQLARLSGVSAAMLSQTEQNKANPTIAVIWKIARALNVGISDLVDTAGAGHNFQVIRREDERYLFRGSDACSVRTLSPLSLEKDIEFYQVDLQPGGSLDSESHFHGTEEMLTVAKGKIALSSAEHEVTLQGGDSVYYSADVNHAITNVGRSPAQVFLVVKYRNE